MRILLILFFICILGRVQSQNQDFQDHVYDENIRTALFYPVDGETHNVLAFPVIYLQKSEVLQLDFDELGDQYKNYNYKLIHCNHDWKQSILNDFEFLEEFNEYSITNYEISLNTRNSYVHYSLQVPKTKISGNYVLKVYRNMNPNDVVLTRRFVVYDTKVSIQPDIKFSLDPALRFSGQQVDFTIHYGDYQIYNPKEMVKVVVRQNGRWDNALYNLQPMFLKDQERILDYHFYNNENMFPGLNEYRGFDLRSIRFRGQNVANVQFDNQKAVAFVIPDQSRNKRTMSQWIDINGRFVIENYETQRGYVEADYVETHFSLDLEVDPDGDVYIFGLLTDWEIKPENKMQKVDGKLQWKGQMKLKQGFYNYSYVVVKPHIKPAETLLEGSYSLTENMYDILVYFRPVGGRYDQVVGYTKFDYNKMR